MTTPISLGAVFENALHQKWADTLSRHPAQLNCVHESDAELVPLPSGDVLAATVDTVAEEISVGIYSEPETIGWVAAVASLSDLAACGAEPIGMLVSATLPPQGTEEFQRRLASGLEAACRQSSTFVLGGDTNIDQAISITTCGLGIVRGVAPLSRRGIEPGQDLYVSGRLGLGAVAAARAMLRLPEELFGESDYRPVPRIAVGAAVRGVASAAMDTSDGFLATLDQLMRVNGVGFAVDVPVEMMLEPRALLVCRKLGLDPLVALAAHHGEFELVLAAPVERRDEIVSRVPTLLRVGRSLELPCVVFTVHGDRRVDTEALRNLSASAAKDPRSYLAKLRAML